MEYVSEFFSTALRPWDEVNVPLHYTLSYIKHFTIKSKARKR